jgi:hypothetical protein
MKKGYSTLLALVFLCIFIAMPSLRADWVPDGTPICTAANDQQYPDLVPDGVGGAIIAWADLRGTDTDIYAQRIDADANELWTSNGVVICAATRNQSQPELISDGAGGAIITWTDFRSGSYSDVYAQRVDSDGNVLWTANGAAIGTASRYQQSPRIVSDGVGGAIISWYDTRSGNGDIYAQRIDAGGTVRWIANGIALCTDINMQYMGDMAADGMGAAVVAWRDLRTDNGDIYAQRIDTLGNTYWPPDGLPICTAANMQSGAELTMDGTGGTIIFWYDERTAGSDIYAQRVSAAGGTQWTADGVVVTANSGNQYVYGVIPDGASGAICVWRDDMSGAANPNIYTQRVNADGSMAWTTNGVLVCNAASYQYTPRIVTDGAGGGIMAWFDYRDGASYDIYVQKITATGTLLWTPNGVPICTADGNQREVELISDGAGGAILTWYDYRGADEDIYAERVDFEGNPVATLLQSYSATPGPSGISIDWILSEAGVDMQFLILRAEGNGPFEEIQAPDILRAGLAFSFIDRTCKPGVAYCYRIIVKDEDGRKILFGTDVLSMPALALTLYQNDPNPFNPSTMIRYYLPAAAQVTLKVYDAAGREIVCLVDREQQTGHHSASWDGRDDRGVMASSGVYFYGLIAGKELLSKKMILLR